mmetsp:Transcript_38220/g.86114  ORF Transcript_38220/g.86114 Transcript_38220/m.86114 type:complete len:116 (-) Transcript_38220:119-466(-)
MVLPILKEKVQVLSLAPEVVQCLDALGAESEGTSSQQSRQKRSRDTTALRTALRAMSLRSLLTTLHRAALPQSSPERAAIDAVLEHLRFHSGFRDIDDEEADGVDAVPSSPPSTS